MEASHGDSSAVRYLFKRGLDVSPRSRYLYLAWATWEEKQGNRALARSLLERGHKLNRRDPALLQVIELSGLVNSTSGTQDWSARTTRAAVVPSASHIMLLLFIRICNVHRRGRFWRRMTTMLPKRVAYFSWRARWTLLTSTSGRWGQLLQHGQQRFPCWTV